MTSLKLVRELPLDAWQQFVQNNKSSNAFHSPEMYQVFKATPNFTPEFWAVVDENDGPQVLMLPVFVSLFSNPLRRLATRSIVYGGILSAPNIDLDAAFSVLLPAYQQHAGGKALFTEFRHKTDSTAVHAALERYGCYHEAELNYLVNLSQPIDQLLQSFRSRTRKRIRQGQRKQAVEVIEVQSETEFNNWYQLLEMTYHHARVPLAPRIHFEEAFQRLVPARMAKFYLAMVGKTPAACSLELLHQGTIYGWYNGVDRQFSHLVPNEMLTWHILSWGVEAGYAVYDWGGAGKPDEYYGVRDFKVKFGGKLVDYGRSRCVHSPRLLAFSERAYRLLRKFL